jgi:hypothetical protein
MIKAPGPGPVPVEPSSATGTFLKPWLFGVIMQNRRRRDLAPASGE